MSTQCNSNSVHTLTDEQAVAQLNALMVEIKHARERCHTRLEDALNSLRTAARIDLALNAADDYARELLQVVEEMEVLKDAHPNAWGESEPGQEELRQQRQMILDAAYMALGGRWPGSERWQRR